MEPVDAALADRIRAYTDVATERRIDAFAVARTAMSSRPAARWSVRRPSRGLGWAAAMVAILLIGIAVTVRQQPPDVAAGPLPEVLRHAWGRPLPYTAPTPWEGPELLDLTSGHLDFRSEEGAAPSRSAITATGPDTFTLTATAETTDCAIGQVGAYGWLAEGSGTVLTLTPTGADACSAREAGVTGQWVRTDFPPTLVPGEALPPGTYVTTRFDPLADPAAPTRLSFAVPAGWKVKQDEARTFVMDHPPIGSQASPSVEPVSVMAIAVLAEPRMAMDFEPGAVCGPTADAPVARHSRDDLVAAIIARPGVISTPPAAVTVAERQGTRLDLQLEPSWTGGCDQIVALPILNGIAPGPGGGVLIDHDHPTRLIILDIAVDRVLAIVIFDIEKSPADEFDGHADAVMPIVESFAFQPAP
jgi:hypothetical protein